MEPLRCSYCRYAAWNRGCFFIRSPKQVPLTGAVIVSTPQDIAPVDVRKGIAMFIKAGVPIIGIVENMSYFECPHCHGRTDIFGHGGAKKDAERLAVPFLGQVPLDLVVRETSDAGTPIVACSPESTQAASFFGYRTACCQVIVRITVYRRNRYKAKWSGCSRCSGLRRDRIYPEWKAFSLTRCAMRS